MEEAEEEVEEEMVRNLINPFVVYLFKKMLKKNSFVIENQIASSLLRTTFLKKSIGQAKLAEIEKRLPGWLKKYSLSPSIFLKLRKK